MTIIRFSKTPKQDVDQRGMLARYHQDMAAGARDHPGVSIIDHGFNATEQAYVTEIRFSDAYCRERCIFA